MVFAINKNSIVDMKSVIEKICHGQRIRHRGTWNAIYAKTTETQRIRHQGGYTLKNKKYQRSGSCLSIAQSHKQSQKRPSIRG